MRTKYALFNTVWYDGQDSWVAKFVLPADTTMKSDCIKTMDGWYDGEILKLDKLYEVTLDNIVAFKNNQETENLYDRFNEMFF